MLTLQRRHMGFRLLRCKEPGIVNWQKTKLQEL